LFKPFSLLTILSFGCCPSVLRDLRVPNT